MSILGEICENASVIWSIKDFFSLPIKVDSSYESPKFSFTNKSWFLRIYPNGRKGDETEGYIGLYLRRENPGPPITVEYSLGMKTVDGKLDTERQNSTYSFDGAIGHGSPKLLSRSKLLERKSDLLPSDTLTLVCKIQHPDFKEYSGSKDTVPKKCSYCNKIFDDQEDIQSHFRVCEELPIQCQKCSEFVAKKNWCDHKCMIDAEADGTLCQDFKKILLDDQSHDLTLKVGDKELGAHQSILKARCRVFESMLNHDTAEKKSGVIDIPDCDPQAMEQFLLYVYCGKVETLNPTNMLALYYIADKYDMRILKNQCCDFIKKSLSHTNICEVIQLALTHSDTSLLEYATEYFMDNTVGIMITVEWQNFLKENTTLGNELLLKSFRRKEQ